MRAQRPSTVEVMRASRSLVAEELRQHGLTVTVLDENRGDLRVSRSGGRRLEVQVRTVCRASDPAYWPRARFQPRPDLYAALVIRWAGEPTRTFLIPSQV